MLRLAFSPLALMRRSRARWPIIVALPNSLRFLLDQTYSTGFSWRSVRRKIFYNEPVFLPFQVFLHQFCLVHPKVINDKDELLPTETLLRILEESQEYCGIHGSCKHLKVHTRPLSQRRASYETDNRAGYPSSWHFENGCLAFWSPCFSHQWLVREGGLVGKPYASIRFEPFFWMAGHRSSFHRLMAASLRFRYRVSGFWLLQPIARRMRHAWVCPILMRVLLRITSATRASVHNSVLYPAATAPLKKRLPDLGNFFYGKPRFWSRAPASQPFFPFLLPYDIPIVNGDAGNLQAAGDLRLTDSSLKERSRLQAALLQCFCILMRCLGWMDNEWFVVHTSPSIPSG